MRQKAIFCLLLAAATVAVYWPVTRYEFSNYDEPDYVLANLHVQAGMTWNSIGWAFTTGHANNWHPLTWLSHMLDWQLFGRNPAGHHATSLVLHAANTVLLFLALLTMTSPPRRDCGNLQGKAEFETADRLPGAAPGSLVWRCFLVAALFALHPLHVESVVWIAERKDVLSTFFFLLTVWAYVRYAQTLERSDRLHRATGRWFYGLALAFFSLGLMSKPMVVTTPFLLLLLDYWPLGRFGGRAPGEANGRPYLWDKLPFLALSAASCVTTLRVQGHGGNMATLESIPIGLRIENALLAYVIYLKKVFWPAGLACYYPYNPSIPPAAVAASGLLLLAVSILFARAARRSPYLLVGWLWYLGALVPVIGLVQVGSQSMADRYTYIPLVGIFLLLVWAGTDAAGALRRLTGPIQWRWFRAALVMATAAALLVCAGITRRQMSYWHDSIRLFQRALSVTADNPTAEFNLGTALNEKGSLDEAEEHLRRTLKLKPDYAEAQSNLGFMLTLKGKQAEAINLYRAALKNRPHLAQTHYLLGSALAAQGDRDGAISEYRLALDSDPDHPLALNDLAWTLATCSGARLRNGPEAVELAEHACRLTRFREAQFVGTLAAAYAEAGRFAEAISTGVRASEIALKTGQTNLVERNKQLVELYRAGKPCRE